MPERTLIPANVSQPQTLIQHGATSHPLRLGLLLNQGTIITVADFVIMHVRQIMATLAPYSVRQPVVFGANVWEGRNHVWLYVRPQDARYYAERLAAELLRMGPEIIHQERNDDHASGTDVPALSRVGDGAASPSGAVRR